MPPEPRGRKVDYGLLQEREQAGRGPGHLPSSGEYAIFRVFDVDSDSPEFYTLEGDLDTVLAVEPVTYRVTCDRRPSMPNGLGIVLK